MILRIARAVFILGGLVLIAVETWLASRPGNRWSPARWALTAWAAAAIGWLLFLFANHVSFPLHLDLMEGAVLEHLRLAMASDPNDPEPTADFVPLAYNPLYYFVTIPLAWVLGPGLPALRVVSILATILCAMVLWLVVRERAASPWWAWMAVGLFAAGYRTMDAYLDTAHSDSAMLATAMLGCLILERRRSTAGTVTGMLLLVASFWFKQHGALFALGGLAYLLRRDGLRRSVPALTVTAVLGPGVYLLAGPALFGDAFWQFTWEVPRAWTHIGLEPLGRLAGYMASGLPVLAPVAFWWWSVRAPDRPA